METTNRKSEKFTGTITFKALVVGFLILILLIPKIMIEELINERQKRSIETIRKINDKWSNQQTICGPILSIPYTTFYVDNKNEKQINERVIHIAPRTLDIKTNLVPEVRHYGMYKAILYRSEILITGEFPKIDLKDGEYDLIMWEKSYVSVGISDLRGVTKNLDFKINDMQHSGDDNGTEENNSKLIVKIKDTDIFESENNIKFTGKLYLNGSSSINFIPVGKTTTVKVSGKWNSPSFIGNFSPEYNITKDGFLASWSVLNFNRAIPEKWLDNTYIDFNQSSFGVSFVEPVNLYQQNTRSVKYALMFITLTFVVFFFVELLSKKRIHPIQYLLVGVALILFYSLLLSLSEHVNFSIAYIIAGISTILLISAYSHSIFKNMSQTAILASLLTILYTFLYITLQLEDVALLIGSIGLFIILGIIMYFSKKINWYKTEMLE